MITELRAGAVQALREGRLVRCPGCRGWMVDPHDYHYDARDGKPCRFVNPLVKRSDDAQYARLDEASEEIEMPQRVLIRGEA
jgi:hypothetical protein